MVRFQFSFVILCSTHSSLQQFLEFKDLHTFTFEQTYVTNS